MRILVLGHKGLLGRELVKQWSSRYHVETMPDDWDCLSHDKLLHTEMNSFNPDWVVNCIGITKAKATDPVETIEVNSIWPHRLARICKQHDAKMLHISTDCVFDGMFGKYSELHVAAPRDLYGKSKLLGEPTDCIVLRTSFIGRHPDDKSGFLEWLLSQAGSIPGYTLAVFSGLTTTAFARAAERVLLSTVREGLFHVGGEPISKYDVAQLVKDFAGGKFWLYGSKAITYDRSLDSTLFQQKFEYRPPSWPSMIQELFAPKDDPTARMHG